MKTTNIYPTSSYNLVNTMPIAEGIKSRNEIFNELNNGFDMSTINLNALSREQLIEYAYALDWNGDWDECEDGQLPITKEELIDSINRMIYEDMIYEEVIAQYQDNEDTIIFVLNNGVLYEGFSLADLMELGGGFKSKEEAISYLKKHSNEEGFNDNMKYFFS